MSDRTPLLINPKAGSLFRSGLKAWLDAHRDDFREVHTKSAEDLTQKARELAESGEPVIAAAGGDGTLMGAAQGLVGTGAALGILPCGTMNVFARELGIGSRQFDIAMEAIKGDKRKDYGKHGRADRKDNREVGHSAAKQPIQ
jgi:diacylglycerol kinase family enzyme